jgi:hypothetical protein
MRMTGAQRTWLFSVAGGWLAGLVLALVWALLITPLAKQNEVVDLTIPEGTAASVSAGQPAKFIPAQLLLGPNRKVRVRNDDIVDHIVAGKTVPAHTSATIQASADAKTLVCTIHPSGYIGVGFDGTPGPMAVLFMATVVGLPVGVVFGGIVHVAKKLDSGGPGAGRAATVVTT